MSFRPALLLAASVLVAAPSLAVATVSGGPAAAGGPSAVRVVDARTGAVTTLTWRDAAMRRIGHATYWGGPIGGAADSTPSRPVTRLATLSWMLGDRVGWREEVARDSDQRIWLRRIPGGELWPLGRALGAPAMPAERQPWMQPRQPKVLMAVLASLAARAAPPALDPPAGLLTPGPGVSAGSAGVDVGADEGADEPAPVDPEATGTGDVLGVPLAALILGAAGATAAGVLWWRRRSRSSASVPPVAAYDETRDRDFEVLTF